MLILILIPEFGIVGAAVSWSISRLLANALPLAQVVSYLQDLRVPLVVWSVGPYGEPDTKWGRAINVRTLSRLDKAFGRLEKNLKRQQIVWLEGLHLPQRVELSPDAEGIALVK